MIKMINGIKVSLSAEPNLEPIVFIHGFPFDHTLWDDVIGHLQDDYYCISYDIRGLGDSEVGSGQYTMEAYVDDLEMIISELNLKNPILCGFSMGGYIALRANERVQGFKALVLANTTTTSDNDEAKIKRANAIKKIEEDGLEGFLEGFLSVAFSQNYTDKNKDKILSLKNIILKFNPIGVKGALLAMVSRTDTTKSLRQTPPILFIEADEDKIIPPKTMQKLSQNTPKSHYAQITNSGHVSMMEQPNEFIKAVKLFLDKVV